MKYGGSLPTSQKPPLNPILSHLNPVHTLKASLSQIHFSTRHILRTLVSPKWSHPFMFSDQHFVCISHFSLLCAPFPNHFILLYLITNILI